MQPPRAGEGVTQSQRADPKKMRQTGVPPRAAARANIIRNPAYRKPLPDGVPSLSVSS